MDDLTAVLVIGLAAWRTASLLVNEDGPWSVFQRIRQWCGVYRTGELNVVAMALLCVWCTSIWTALALSLLWRLAPFAVVVLAAAALAPIIDSVAIRGADE